MLALLVLLGLARYPVAQWPLAVALAAYTALLWYRPAAFLLVLPIVLPAWDLGLWTGWMMVGESDLFILTTIAVLMVRDPPQAIDLRVASAPRVVLLAFTAGWLIATVVGMSSPLGATHSDNAFLRPDNALRLAKGLIEALALLPSLRQRQRVHGDAVTLLGWGLAAGLCAVTLIVLAERALFASILDFSTAYRVAGPFSSMRVGGGHIGAYTALVLPFVLCLFQLRPRWLGSGLAMLACLCGGYTLAVTFARTAYAAGMVAMAVAGPGWLWAANQRRTHALAFGIVPVVLVLSALAATAAFTGMHERFAASAMDLSTRQQNWRAGLAVRDPGVPAALFGMGLGTYQRTMLSRSPVNRPSDLVLKQDDEGTYASMRVETPFYLGQKIALPETGFLHLTLRARSPDGQTALGVAICDKVLLYSDNCRGADTKLVEPDHWVTVAAAFPLDGLGGRALFGVLRRPVELSLFGRAGHTIDIRDISLSDDAGRPMLVNGDFGHGLDRWIFTDDSHVSWRMLNQYLMLFFETGILGLMAFAALAGLALAGGVRALRGGALAGAVVAGAVAGFMVSGLFDNVLEAPRLATLFFLVCWCGLIQWEAGASRSGRSAGATMRLSSK
ncbi:MAG: hypothetical protein P4L90_22240 [Rhodopila sp.]|nr:hypothetical protein [Rhodopila sp.]